MSKMMVNVVQFPLQLSKDKKQENSHFQEATARKF